MADKTNPHNSIEERLLGIETRLAKIEEDGISSSMEFLRLGGKLRSIEKLLVKIEDLLTQK